MNYIFPTYIAILGALTTAVLIFAVFMLNDYWVFRYFYFRKSKAIFVLITFLLIFCLAVLHFTIEYYFFHPYRIVKPPHDIPVIFPVLRSFLLFGMVSLISITLLLSDTIKKQALRQKKLQEEKIGTELKLLKAQINPHFLFNALNNIFSLSYAKSDKAPDSVLKLSEMLRYVIYDCSHDSVTLHHEVEYIKNFIAFQKMKSEHRQNITFDSDEIQVNKEISPMLFVPFIENAFKYSRIEEEKNAQVDIKLASTKHEVRFEIVNTLPETGKPQHGKGLGIKNVKQRLDVLYPDNYELNIAESDKNYSVSLKIML